MSETQIPTEADYRAAKEEAIEKTVAFLKVGDALGKDPSTTAFEFMAAFQVAATEAIGA